MNRNLTERSKCLSRSIRLAEPNDISQLGIVGPAAFAETYSTYWDDVNSYMERLNSFGGQALAALLDRSDTRIWVAEINGTIVGFAILIFKSEGPFQRFTDGVMLSRLYLVGPARALGMGRMLIDAAIADARCDGSKYIWLEAMTLAKHAIDAYKSWGFQMIGEKHFESEGVKSGFSDMIVMAKML